MGAPITINEDALRRSFHWTVHFDRFKPKLEDVEFDIHGKQDTLSGHLLAVTDTDALKDVLVSARAQLETICAAELAASPDNAHSVKSWNENYLRYYDGLADRLVDKVCDHLPEGERPQLVDGRSVNY